MSDDISLPEPFEVIFSVGQTTSTSCITINITSDTESEVDESFTISITSTGIEPYAVVGDLSVTTITIFDDDNDDEGNDNQLRRDLESWYIDVLYRDDTNTHTKRDFSNKKGVACIVIALTRYLVYFCETIIYS